MSSNKKIIIVMLIILVIFMGDRYLAQRRERVTIESSSTYESSVSSSNLTNSTNNQNIATQEEGGLIFELETFEMEMESEQLDINRATIEEMLERGLSMSHIQKIVDYREETGGFESTLELERISGIGERTRVKLEEYLIVEERVSKKALKINSGSKELYKLYGLDNKVIKKLINYLETGTKVSDNLELEKVIGVDAYNELVKEGIKFDFR